MNDDVLPKFLLTELSNIEDVKTVKRINIMVEVIKFDGNF